MKKGPESKYPHRKGRPVSSEAQHRHIAAALRARIRSGEWDVGTVLPSRRALVEKYKVGGCAVQLALNVLKRDGMIELSPQRRLVVAPQTSPGTEPDNLVLEVMTSNPSLLLANDALSQMQNGIALGSGQIRSPLLLVYDDRLRKTVPLELLERPLKGILVVGKVSPRALAQYQKLHLPVVLADHPGRKSKVHAIGVENDEAAFDAVMRLRALGHQRIAFLQDTRSGKGEIQANAMERQKGFVRAYPANTNASARAHIYTFSANKSKGRPGIQGLLQAEPAYTAALVSDSNTAQKLITAAKEAGRSVPQNFSVVCFSSAGNPDQKLSGPRIDFQEMGRRALYLLKEPRRPVLHQKLPTQWHDGKTIAPPDC